MSAHGRRPRNGRTRHGAEPIDTDTENSTHLRIDRRSSPAPACASESENGLRSSCAAFRPRRLACAYIALAVGLTELMDGGMLTPELVAVGAVTWRGRRGAERRGRLRVHGRLACRWWPGACSVTCVVRRSDSSRGCHGQLGYGRSSSSTAVAYACRPQTPSGSRPRISCSLQLSASTRTRVDVVL